MAGTLGDFRRPCALLCGFALDSYPAGRRACAATPSIQPAISSAGHGSDRSFAGYGNSLPRRVHRHSIPLCRSDSGSLLAAVFRRTLEHQRLIGSDVLALWVVFFNLNIDMTRRLISFAIVPAIMPSYLALGPSTPNSTLTAIAMTLTSLELAVGLFLIHLGPKRGFAFTVFALIVSLFGAVGLDMLLRM